MAKNKIQTVEDKLKALYNLQKIDSEIEQIRTLRGELPIQIEDLKIACQKFEEKKEKISEDAKGLKNSIAEKDNSIKESQELIEKYEKQQMNVRNNREFDSLNKEIEFQGLEIELSKKRIKEYKVKLDACKVSSKEIVELLKDKQTELSIKEGELDTIVQETKSEEDALVAKSEVLEQNIDENLLTKYKNLRENMKNSIAIAVIERNACGGCFSVVPPQRKVDIASRNKIIICENCGRILVDAFIDGKEAK